MTDVSSPVVPSHVPADWADQLAAQLTAEQYAQLTQPLHRSRVGTNPKGYSHVEAWDVRRTLIRVFGFGGFDVETLRLEQVAQIETPPGSIKYDNGGTNDKSRWTVVYRAQVRLIVKDRHGREIAHFDDGAAGDSTNQPSLGDAHDNALKTALSQALKRCAVNWGDQFGLSLYNGGGGRPDPDTGYLKPVVLRSLVAPPAPGGGAGEDTAVIDQAQDGPVLPEPSAAPVSAPPAAETEAYSPAIGSGRPVGDQAPVDEAETPAEQPAPDTEPPPAPPAPKASPDQVYEAGVAAIATAKGLVHLNELTKLVELMQRQHKITDGQAGRLRLKIAARRDELGEQSPDASPPALTDDTDGAVIGTPA